MNREAVLMIMFDVPTETKSDRKKYINFRKNLIKSGFTMFQKSIYIKLLRNISSTNEEIKKIREFCATSGNVRAITMNLQQFKKMHVIVGENVDFKTFSDPILVV